MGFPSKEHIERIISMAGMDEGFFSIAVYSFIEKYLKDFIRIRDEYSIEERECNFRSLLLKFWAGKFHKDLYEEINYETRKTYLRAREPDDKLKALFLLANGKGNADKVRHNFDFGNLEQLQTSINDLFKFLKIAEDDDSYKAFEILNTYLKNWDKRENSEALQKQVDTLNARILSFIEKNANNIKTIESLRNAQAEYENRIQTLENKISDNENNSEELETLRKENDLLLEYIENLRQLTVYTRSRNDYEQSIIRLSVEQKKVIEDYNDQPLYIINGTAGSGKSILLLKIIEKIIKQNQYTQYVCLTKTKSLTSYNRFTASLINTAIDESSIKLGDIVLSRALYSYFPQIKFSSNKQNSNEDSQKNKDDIQLTKDLFKHFFPQTDFYYRLDAAKELAGNIWPNFITKDEFFDQKTIVSCTTPKNIIWQFAEDCTELLESGRSLKDVPESLAYYCLAQKLETEDSYSNYDYLFVDEAQDFTAAQLVCFKNMTEHLILAGDNNQSIFNKGITFEFFQKEPDCTTYTLATNFRNTIQINDFAEDYRKLHTSEQINNTNILSKGFRNGPTVEIYQFDKETKNYKIEIYKAIKAKIDLYVEELGYEPDNICILTSCKVEEKLKDFQKLGITLDEPKKQERFEQTGNVKISTIQSAKGLSFPVVLFIAGENNLTQTEEFIKEQQALYYTAMTRAMDILNIFAITSDSTPSYVSDILKVRNGTDKKGS